MHITHIYCITRFLQFDVVAEGDYAQSIFVTSSETSNLTEIENRSFILPYQTLSGSSTKPWTPCGRTKTQSSLFEP